MKKKWLSCLLGMSILFFPQWAKAAPANPEVFENKQPSGETFNAQTKGDEHFNYVVTEAGQPIEQGEDGYWYYLEDNLKRDSSNEYALSKAKVGIDVTPQNLASEDTVVKKGIENKTKLDVENEEKSPETRMMNTTHNLLVVLVEFDDVKIKYSDQDWERLIFWDEAPSLKNYYFTMTNNRLLIQPAKESYNSTDDGVVKVKLNKNHPNTGSSINAENQKITREALEQADQYIDYSQYDTNRNGRIEKEELHFMIIVAGQETSYGLVTEPAVWGHRWALNEKRITLDNTELNLFTQFGEKHGLWLSTLGIIAHEFGHDLGLPDLYNGGYTDENGDTTKTGQGLGQTSLMAGGSWGAKPGERGGSTPVGLDAYSRKALGFEVETIDKATDGKIVQSLDQGIPTVLKVNTDNEKEYFLIENRQLTGYDAGMTNSNAVFSGGIAIYRINESYYTNHTVGKQLVTIVEADQGIRGYSFYDNGGYRGADPFYYIGTGIHKKRQLNELRRDTTPSNISPNGEKAAFDIIVNDASNGKMSVTLEDPKIAIESLTLFPEDMELEIEETHQLNVSVKPENATNKEIIWSSSDENVVAVNQSGVVTAKSSGTVTITAKTKEGNKEARSTVKVKKANGTFGTVPWEWDESTQTVTFGKGEFPNSNASCNIKTDIESNQKLAGKKIKKIVFTEPVKLSQNANLLFDGLSELETIENLEKLDTSNVTSMFRLFSFNEKLKHLDLNSWNTTKVTNMGLMFYRSSSLTSVALDKWDTTNVTNMRQMFNYSGINSLDLTNWNTQKVTDMSEAFNKIDSIILGENFQFKDISSIGNSTWVNQEKNVVYQTGTEFVKGYDGSKPGKYEKGL